MKRPLRSSESKFPRIPRLEIDLRGPREGNLNDLRAILGNDVAIKAYREGNRAFPDGTIIARLAWSYVPWEESEKAFGGGPNACGYGRTPTHNPRLSTTCQPSRHEQVLAGNVEDETSCAGQIGRYVPACGLFAEAEPGAIDGALLRGRAGNSRLPPIALEYLQIRWGQGL